MSIFICEIVIIKYQTYLLNKYLEIFIKYYLISLVEYLFHTFSDNFTMSCVYISCDIKCNGSGPWKNTSITISCYQ